MKNFDHDVLVPAKVPEEPDTTLLEGPEPALWRRRGYDTVETTEASETWHR
jgi:hypothetical protein